MRLFFFITFISVTMYSQGQTGSITSAGENISKNGRIVSWSIGSLITGGGQTTKYQVRAGDIQPAYEVFYEQSGDFIKLDCYPNPAVDFVNIELHTNDFEGMRWMLHSTSGQQIKSGKLASNKIEIPVTDLSATSYILSIYNKDKDLVSRAKLLKK